MRLLFCDEIEGKKNSIYIGKLEKIKKEDIADEILAMLDENKKAN